jgi:hypothetical protein
MEQVPPSAVLVGPTMTKLTISEQGAACEELYRQMKEIENLQLKIGEEMSVLIFKQMRLAEKMAVLNTTMEKVMKL